MSDLLRPGHIITHVLVTGGTYHLITCEIIDRLPNGHYTMKVREVRPTSYKALRQQEVHREAVEPPPDGTVCNG